MLHAALSLAFGILALALCGCATAPPMDNATEIAFAVSSWGYTQEQWTVRASGEATLALVPPTAQIDSPPVTSSATITPEQFERVRAAMAPLRRYVGVTLPCPNHMYDAPSIGVRWTQANADQAQIGYYTGCSDTPARREAYDAIMEGNRVFHEVTGLH